MTEEEKTEVKTETVLEPQTPTTEMVEGEPYDAQRAMDTIRKLRDEIKALKPRAKLADEYDAAEKKRQEAELSEMEKLRKHVADVEAELNAMRLNEQRRAIAVKLGLPEALADRIHGETPDMMEADAKILLEAIPKPQTPPNSKIPATNPGASGRQGETDAERRKRLLG